MATNTERLESRAERSFIDLVKNMAKLGHISKAEVVRRAVNLYAQVESLKERQRYELKDLSVDDQILIANMILNPAAAHDGLVSTLRAHAEDVEVR
jgi:hypothetical protein